MSRADRAWALKERCYAAWHTEPAQARVAAQDLAALLGPDAGPEVAALAHWTSGIADLAEGRLAEALARLECAQAGFEGLGDGQHAAETQVPQMVALAMLGREAEAEQRGRAALAQFLVAGDDRSAGKIELNLGTMLSRQDRHAEAEHLFRGAAVRFARAGDAEYSIGADIAIANALTWQFRFDEALRVNARARMRARERGLPMLVGHAEQAIGRIELNRGRWQAALQALAAAVAQLAGAPPQRRIEAEAALADAYLAVNLLDEAVALYDQVIAEAQVLAAPTEEAWARLQRARALGRRGEPDAALAELDRARAHYVAAGNAAALAYAELCRGRIALASGDAAAAQAAAEAALASLHGSGLRGWQLEARVLRAGAQLQQGDTAAAAAALVECLQAATDQPSIRLACLLGLGQAAESRGRPVLARRHYTRVLDEVDRARRTLADDDARAALAADAEQAHGRLVALAADAGEPPALLQALEAGQARGLAAGLALEAPTAPRPPEAARWHWLRERWQQAVAEGDDTQRQALEPPLVEAARRAAVQTGAVPAAAPDPIPSAAELAAALGRGRVLVLFHRQQERLVALVVRPDGLRLVQQAVPQLPARLQGLRFQLDALRFGGSPALQAHAAQLMQRARQHLQALHALVWAPLAEAVGDACHVVLVPHGDLHYLPFAALHDGQGWLVERHALSLAPSAAVWARLQARPPRPLRRALVAGVGGPGLPQVAAEVAAVAAAFGDGATLLAGAQASRAAVLAGAAEADVLHLACHGRFRADSPAFSELRLHDGPLTLLDLGHARLGADLVTLSACETGISRIAPGGELRGLVRACMLAGARNVLATLWPVQDEASARLMGDFYGGLLAGEVPAIALQAAQRTAAAGGAHPWLWAGHQLHGRG